MKRVVSLALALVLLLAVCASCAKNDPQAVQTNAEKETAASHTPEESKETDPSLESETASQTGTPTPSETAEPTATITPADTPTPTVTPEPEPPLKGKTALFVGDVLTAGLNGDDGQPHGWAEKIAQTHELASVRNAAQNRASVTTAAGSLLILDQIREEADNAYDFVIIEGGVVDAENAIKVDIGRIVPKSADETADGDLDPATFAGGFETILKTAKASFPNAAIGCVIAGRMTAKAGCISDMRRFAEVIRLACEKWGVHVLDLYDNAAFEEEYQPGGTKSVNRDKILPKDPGYEIYARYIAEFMIDIAGRTREPVTSVRPGVCDVATVLSGKKVIYYGDSICDKTSHDDPERVSNYGYAGRIMDLYGVKTFNRAKSGASLSTVRKTNLIMAQTRSDQNRNVNMIVMEGGVNDAWDVAPVGEMSDMPVGDFDPDKLDKSTMAGGLEEILYFLTTHHPEAVIVYMINFKLNSGAGALNSMKSYVEMIKKICDKWGVAYLDLYNDGWFNARFDIMSKTNCTDGIHPNAAGYDLIAPVLAAFMADTLVAAHPEKYAK